MFLRKIFFNFVFIAVLFSMGAVGLVRAEENNSSKSETLEVKVTKILEEKEVKPANSDQWQTVQKLEAQVLVGSKKGETIVLENGGQGAVMSQRFDVGTRLMVAYNKEGEEESFFISDVVRRDSLLWLFVIFIAIVLLVTRLQGLTSLLGMVISFVVIFSFILPQISKGANPILIAILGSFLIIPVTFYLSHGFNQKTTIAIFGTVIALIFTGILAAVFIEISKLSGFASEEAGFLQSDHPGLINIKGLILAGIIIGVLGILDDITVAQASIVRQLKEANEKLKTGEIYLRAMKVGRDHISSMVNTLILVYTGAALPLLLLFIDNPRPFSEVINYEIIAEEVIRTLVASIGLILAVPITTLIASFVSVKKG